jgi:hypothetical protein
MILEENMKIIAVLSRDSEHWKVKTRVNVTLRAWLIKSKMLTIFWNGLLLWNRSILKTIFSIVTQIGSFTQIYLEIIKTNFLPILENSGTVLRAHASKSPEMKIVGYLSLICVSRGVSFVDDILINTLITNSPLVSN